MENQKWSDQKFEEFQKLCTPLVKWLQKNAYGSETVIITDHFAKILSDEMGIPFDMPDDY